MEIAIISYLKISLNSSYYYNFLLNSKIYISVFTYATIYVAYNSLSQPCCCKREKYRKLLSINCEVESQNNNILR